MIRVSRPLVRSVLAHSANTSSLTLSTRHLTRSFATKNLYTAQAHTTGGRSGKVTSKDGNLTLTLAKPTAMGGAKGEVGTNPEQLFAAGYSACFQGAMGLASTKVLKKDLPSATSIDARVSILRSDEGENKFKLHLEVEFDVKIPGFTKEEAQKVVDEAHQICPYSNATRGNIPVRLKVV